MERGGARGGTHIAGPLAARYRVIALDRPGHGYSERPADAWPNPLAQAHIAHGLAQGLGLERPILVGHSWAGSLVLAYLLAYPGEAAGAVLLAGGTHPWEGAWPGTTTWRGSQCRGRCSPTPWAGHWACLPSTAGLRRSCPRTRSRMAIGPAPLGPGPAPPAAAEPAEPLGVGEGGLVARAASQVHRGERVRYAVCGH